MTCSAGRPSKATTAWFSRDGCALPHIRWDVACLSQGAVDAAEAKLTYASGMEAALQQGVADAAVAKSGSEAQLNEANADATRMQARFDKV